jgi:hypothetical protein
VLRYKGTTDDVSLLRQRYEEYEAGLRRMDFGQSPDLPRYFGNDFFNDGELVRFEQDLRANTLTFELESIEALNEVYDRRAAMGLPRDMQNHRCEDFRYTCTFKGVVYLREERGWVTYGDDSGAEYNELPRRCTAEFEFGEIMDSPLRRRLSRRLGREFFHLRISTQCPRQIDVVFEKVTVRKSNAVKYESYLGGRRIVLRSLFRL